MLLLVLVVLHNLPAPLTIAATMRAVLLLAIPLPLVPLPVQHMLLLQVQPPVPARARVQFMVVALATPFPLQVATPHLQAQLAILLLHQIYSLWYLQ